MATNMETVASTDLSALTGPPGPVLRPANCPGYGQELPGHWRCPTCAIADDCYARYVSNSRAANNRGSFSSPPRKLD
jgi:rubredoxin